ncbi:hypothetical protein TCE0_043f15549 [Talaromyces pinophilus]|uniref:Uncharacterized protein n=1 Tax=Talaromyces pinophilus TaxID=128442 RepID=A0A0B8MYM4_TALPI|nr:hypothetical protein TCE0_043f15549 [Talaromyces pinophilus]
MADQLPPPGLAPASVTGKVTNASFKKIKTEDASATGQIASAEPVVKKEPTLEQLANYKRLRDEVQKMGEELGYEEQMPFKKQHRVPELSPFAAGYWKEVRERLDTQISEIKKYRETEWNPHRERLTEKEKELRELEKEIKEMKRMKDRMQRKLKTMQDGIDSTRALLHSIEDHNV